MRPYFCTIHQVYHIGHDYSLKIDYTQGSKKIISNRNDKIWPDRFMSICKIKKKIGWKPEISLTNGIELMLENERTVR